MRIQVTQAHIDAGKRKRCTKCPVALAVREALGIRLVKVGFESIFLGRPHMTHVRFPHEIEGFMLAFDDNWSHGVTPFAFDLDVPPTA